jgi:AcrR family transcriptional regulator
MAQQAVAKTIDVKTRTAPPAKPDPQQLGTKERILAVATQQFAGHGFDGVVIRDIAKAAGISLPSVYHFFGNKRELYEYACMVIFEQQNAALIKALNSSDDPLAALKTFTIKLISILSENNDFARLLQREIVDADYTMIDNTTRKTLQPNFEMLLKIIAKISPASKVFSDSIAVYALAFGLATLRPVFAQLGGKNTNKMRSPAETADLVLTQIFPDIDWRTLTPRPTK